MSARRLPGARTQSGAASKAWWLLAVAAIAGLAAFGWSRFGATGAARIDPDDARLVAMGRQVYDALCASCHGA